MLATTRVDLDEPAADPAVIAEAADAARRRLVATVDPAHLPEASFLRIPLVRQALTDPVFRLRARPVDTTWHADEAVKNGVTGFHPLLSTYYYGARSPFADWLLDPVHAGRELNSKDQLTRQVFFLAHDYLHSWCFNLVRRLMPELGVGEAPIDAQNLDTFAFVHLLTEAAATVGLDYWYLSTVDVTDVVRIGMDIDALTVSYKERYLAAEYRRFFPGLEVQAPEFFGYIARAYCDGEWPGFDLAALRLSARLDRWITHEIRYGVLQRRYAREWLGFLSAGRVPYRGRERDFARPLAWRFPWQAALAEEVGRRLWAKIKEGALDPDDRDPRPRCLWTEAPPSALDFRFVSIHAVDPDEVTKQALDAQGPTNFEYYFGQYVSAVDASHIHPRARDCLPFLRESRDPELLRYVLRDQVSLAPAAGDPPVLFFLP